jgi:hypothetical protein
MSAGRQKHALSICVSKARTARPPYTTDDLRPTLLTCRVFLTF